jgi:hypothetical protein
MDSFCVEKNRDNGVHLYIGYIDYIQVGKRSVASDRMVELAIRKIPRSEPHVFPTEGSRM